MSKLNLTENTLVNKDNQKEIKKGIELAIKLDTLTTDIAFKKIDIEDAVEKSDYIKLATLSKEMGILAKNVTKIKTTIASENSIIRKSFDITKAELSKGQYTNNIEWTLLFNRNPDMYEEIIWDSFKANK